MDATETSTLPLPMAQSPAAAAFGERLAVFRARVDRELATFLATKRQAAAGSVADLTASVEALIGGGGKRLRPLLIYGTHRALGGRCDETAVMDVALSTEMLHAYLLIHDDIMDHAEIRRGAPASHAWFRAQHLEQGWSGDAADYGRSVAILVGDLAHCWAVELYQRGRRRAVDDVVERTAFDPVALDEAFCAMCEEVIGGQFLEMRLPYKAQLERPEEAELVTALRLKSGRYSVERPIELGAILAGAPQAVRAALSRYGQGAGEAFQLQDDILGTFGDEVEVGKPVASDLREGKHTLLVHYALDGASETDSLKLRSFLGRPDLSTAEIAEARRILRDSSGLARVRARIDAALADARAALEGIGLGVEDRELFEGMLAYLRERRT